MKIYSIDKTSNNRVANLGAKITLAKLNQLLNTRNTILVRNIADGAQFDFRIKKVPEEKKMDKGYKTIKAYYLVNLEIGKEGFEAFSPKIVSYEQNMRFHSLERALNMLESKQNLKRADWIIG